MYVDPSGGLYQEKFVEEIIKRMEEVEEGGSKLAGTLDQSGQQDMSVMAMQRLNDQYVHTLPSHTDLTLLHNWCLDTMLEMVIVL